MKNKLSIWISLTALIISALTFGLTRCENWDAARARREKALFLSYRLGVNVGIYLSASKIRKIPSPANVAAAAEEMLKNVPGLINALGLGVQVSSFSPDILSADALNARLLGRIRDLHGKRAAEAYILGADVGQGMGALLPLSLLKTPPRGPLPPIFKPSALTALVAHLNQQLRALGFDHQISMDGKSAAEGFALLSALDNALVNAWDAEKGRWRRTLELP